MIIIKVFPMGSLMGVQSLLVGSTCHYFHNSRNMIGSTYLIDAKLIALLLLVSLPQWQPSEQLLIHLPLRRIHHPRTLLLLLLLLLLLPALALALLLVLTLLVALALALAPLLTRQGLGLLAFLGQNPGLLVQNLQAPPHVLRASLQRHWHPAWLPPRPLFCCFVLLAPCHLAVSLAHRNHPAPPRHHSNRSIQCPQ